MKKLLILLCVLFLTACNSNVQSKTVSLKNETVAYDDAVIDLVKSAIVSDSDVSYQLSEGYRVINCDDINNVTDSRFILYPVYQNEKLTNFIVKAKNNAVINVSEELASEINDSFAAIEVDGNVYILVNDRVIKVYGSSEVKDEKMKKLLKEVDLKTVIDKTNLTNIDTSSIFANTRIVVRFIDGDVDTYISEYSHFCNGSLKSYNQTTGNYVFVFEKLDDNKLKDLVENSKKLDYVLDAFLETVNETNPVSNVNLQTID